MKCQLYTPGLMRYTDCWAWQKELQQQKIQFPETLDALILVEHPPVYTLGQGSTTEFIKFAPGTYEVHRTERGGEVTYHGPGQLVGYPILDLKQYRQDLHWYLRQLEEVLIQAIAPLGLSGSRIPGMTGVWVGDYKIAAIGIKVSRWVTLHGFALNVTTDLRAFEEIVPCGLTKPVGNLQQFVPEITLTYAQSLVEAAFMQVFGVALVR
jgi:lipoyl(octanoyl) transferase